MCRVEPCDSMLGVFYSICCEIQGPVFIFSILNWRMLVIFITQRWRVVDVSHVKSKTNVDGGELIVVVVTWLQQLSLCSI